MHITSRVQYDAWTTSGVPDLERVRDNVWALPMLMGHGKAPSSFCYLVRDADARVHVIDPGTDSEDNWGALVFALGRIAATKSDVASIVVTHLHPDHMGLAETLRRATGAPLILHRAEQEAMTAPDAWSPRHERLDAWGIPSSRRVEVDQGANRRDLQPHVIADVLVEDGDRLDVPGRDLTVVHTPGHTNGHIVVRDATDRLLFTGDHVLPEENPGLGLGGRTDTNPVDDYLASLERLSDWADHEVLPGHGYRFEGLATRTAQLAAHHLHRSLEVAEVLKARPRASVWEVASALSWSSGWSGLRGFYLLSALAQTSMHVSRLQAPPR